MTRKLPKLTLNLRAIYENNSNWVYEDNFQYVEIDNGLGHGQKGCRKAWPIIEWDDKGSITRIAIKVPCIKGVPNEFELFNLGGVVC